MAEKSINVVVEDITIDTEDFEIKIPKIIISGANEDVAKLLSKAIGELANENFVRGIAKDEIKKANEAMAELNNTGNED